MNKIAAALVKARRAFGPALKDKNNPAFRSKYADLGACIEAVDDALLENGIALAQETSEDSTGVTVETVLIHESGETMRFGKLHVPAAKQDPQGYGSALTYCRRYSLMAACGIAPEDDDGNAASKPRSAAVPEPVAPPPSPADLKREQELTDLAMYLIDCHQQGKETDAVRVFYDPATWNKDNPTATEEQKFVWGLLKNESKFRAVLKANSPHIKAA